jgi:hypothetical protein
MGTMVEGYHQRFRMMLASAGQARRINSFTTREGTAMNTFDEHDDIISDNGIDEQRDIIRGSLNEIVNDIGMAMRDVGLTFPVYMTVGNSGQALATIVTTFDPSSADWQQASAIVCRVLEEKVGCSRLRGQELPCAIANAGVINANRRDDRIIR